MSLAAHRRTATRTIVLDRSLEALPLFRLSDSADDSAVTYAPESGGRWRVLPTPGDRVPGTFDQDVYVELLRRYHEANCPHDGALTFTLHAFLRSIGRRVDGRTYEQLRGALTRLEGRFTILSSIAIERRRNSDREQLALFPTFSASEPGDARVTISTVIRANIAEGHIVTLSAPRYLNLSSPVARRLYRLLEVAREDGTVTWRIALDQLAEQLPLAQRYPSHLQRVLQPAHQMLLAEGLARDIAFKQHRREWFVDYVLASRLV